MDDDRLWHSDEVACLERELAAVLRQRGRAVAANDVVAQQVEDEAFVNRIRRLCFHRLALRIGISSDDWFWVDAGADYCIEQSTERELRAVGRVSCSLPDGHQRWTEPFVAEIAHGATGEEGIQYTIRLGASATLLDLPAVRRLAGLGEALELPPPTNEDGWAFVFHTHDEAELGAAPDCGSGTAS